jgi:hypothetical protein
MADNPMRDLGEYCPPDPDFPDEKMVWHLGGCVPESTVAKIQGIYCEPPQAEFEGVCRAPEQIAKIKADRAAKGHVQYQNKTAAPSQFTQAAVGRSQGAAVALFLVGAVAAGVWLARWRR